MISAFRAGKQNLTFPGRPADASPPCYTPFPRLEADLRRRRKLRRAARRISRYAKHIRFRAINILRSWRSRSAANGWAKRHGSSASLRLKRPRSADRKVSFPTFGTPVTRRIANSIAPHAVDDRDRQRNCRFSTSAMEGMGQGYAGQMTPFQMALIAAGPANLEGKSDEAEDRSRHPPQMFAQVLSPQQAAVVREIMSTVTEEAGGTGTRRNGEARRHRHRNRRQNRNGGKGRRAGLRREDGKLKTVTKRKRKKPANGSNMKSR